MPFRIFRQGRQKQGRGQATVFSLFDWAIKNSLLVGRAWVMAM